MLSRMDTQAEIDSTLSEIFRIQKESLDILERGIQAVDQINVERALECHRLVQQQLLEVSELQGKLWALLRADEESAAA